jgi:arylsulfatase A-like enzyme
MTQSQSATQTGSSSSSAPNIILINCDDLGYGDLGCYGSEVNATPALDRLAAEGTRFTDFYMASPVCSPSRCAMMTGCYPPRIDCGEFDDGRPVLFPGNATGLDPEEQTVAALLKEKGYATALIGKWHCGDQPEFLPTRHGFDHYYGLPYSNDMGMMHARDHVKTPLPLLLDEEVIQEQPDQTNLTERYVEESVRFMRESREKDQPFFLYFAHMYVHRPLLVSERFLKGAKNGPYGAAVECIDWATDAIMTELKRLGIDDNTLVIFTSDNGSRGEQGGDGGSNAPLRGQKGTTWDGGQRVPFIARWPGQVPAGRVNDSVLSAIDFLPTFTALADAPSPEKTIDGKDFSDLLLGRVEKGPRDTFLYYWRHQLCAIRHGDWKMHVYRGGWGGGEEARELYNLRQDIGEQHNLYEDNPRVVADLRRLMEEAGEDIGNDLADQPGKNRRPKGRVENPKPLTEYDPEHPYIIAMYDGDAG